MIKGMSGWRVLIVFIARSAGCFEGSSTYASRSLKARLCAVVFPLFLVSW